MFHHRHAFLMFTLLGCSDEDSAAPGGVGDSGDSAAPAVDGSFGFAIGGDFEGSTLSLVHVSFGEQLERGQSYGGVEVSSDLQFIVLPPPSADELEEGDPQGAPGLFNATYLPVLHIDSDGDLEHTKGEEILAVGKAWVVFYEGELAQGQAEAGITLGWNVLEFATGGKGDGITVHDPQAVPLEERFQLGDLKLGGTYQGATANGKGLALLPPAVLESDDLGAVESLVYDELLVEKWQIELTEAPPADHFQELDEFGVYGAAEVPVVYLDLDGSLTYSEGDERQHSACLKGNPVLGIYVETPTDLETAFQVGNKGYRGGWVAVIPPGKGGSATVLADEEILQLVAEESCRASGGGGKKP